MSSGSKVVDVSEGTPQTMEHPYVMEAVTLCDRGCNSMCTGTPQIMQYPRKAAFEVSYMLREEGTRGVFAREVLC